MDLKEYSKFVESAWSSKDNAEPLRDLFIMTTGLGEEAGEVQGKIKKHIRDGTLNRNDIALELGDVLYYWCKIATHYGLDVNMILDFNVRKLTSRIERGMLKGSGDKR